MDLGMAQRRWSHWMPTSLCLETSELVHIVSERSWLMMSSRMSSNDQWSWLRRRGIRPHAQWRLWMQLAMRDQWMDFLVMRHVVPKSGMALMLVVALQRMPGLSEPLSATVYGWQQNPLEGSFWAKRCRWMRRPTSNVGTDPPLPIAKVSMSRLRWLDSAR